MLAQLSMSEYEGLAECGYGDHLVDAWADVKNAELQGGANTKGRTSHQIFLESGIQLMFVRVQSRTRVLELP